MFQFNPNLIFISVDSGKSGNKFSWLNQHHQIESDVFATLARQVSESEATFSGDSNLLTIDSQNYLVGGTGSYALDNDHSKLSKTHELCVLTSVAKVISEKLKLAHKKEAYDVVLSINVPLQDFKSATKNEYKELYQDKEFSLKLNGQDVSFKIKHLELFFESQGAIIRNQQLANKQVLVYDVGGKNDTFVLYSSEGKPLPGKNDMNYDGLLVMLQHIADDLRRKYNTKFSIQDVERMVILGRDKVEGFDDLFEQHATEWVKKFKSQVMKLDINTQLTTILFSGGGSIALKKQLTEAFKEYKDVQFSNDGKYDNACGGLIKALNLYAK